MQLLDGERHLLGGRDEQGGEPDRGRLVLLGGVQDRLDRHLLAEVDDGVAVVGQDRVDQRLADVVHVAEHGRQHDGALRVALELLEVLLELRDGALHDLGALEHERQDQLAGAELVADLLHGRQQHVVERRDGADLLHGRVDLVLHAVALAPQDVPVQRLLGLHARGRVGRLGLGLGTLGLEVLDEDLERVVAAVEDEVVGERALGFGDLAVGRDVVRVDHREVEPGLDAVVQEDGVQDAARRQADAEARRWRRRATSSRRAART